VVDWGVVCLLAANCGSIVRYAGYGRRYLRRGTADDLLYVQHDYILFTTTHILVYILTCK